MRPVIYCFSVFLLNFLLTSCDDDDVKLYHPWEEPEVRWFLKTVDYPDENPGFTTRLDQTFFYTEDEQVTKISNPSKTDSVSKMDYMPDRVSLSRLTKSGTTTTYDSLILKLNDKRQTEYALHLTYREQEGREKSRSNYDSTVFVYDAAGYMIQFDRYTGTNSNSTHTAKHTIVNGNITQIDITYGRTLYKYVYTYDDKEHANPAEYCYEMPFNVSGLTGCSLFTYMSFLTDYFGTRSKNNVIRVIAERSSGTDITPYGDITYKYTFDENDLVTKVEMSGTSRSNRVFENYVTSFVYDKKEIY